MARTNGELLIVETDKYLSENTPVETDTENTLPFEVIDDYLDDPVGFGDVTGKLFSKVRCVFDLAVKFNRHSSDYLKSLAHLEKGIKYLGGSCLQKYALEQKKYVFPELGQLNTANLYTMTAIHFNKIDRALTEYMKEHQVVNDALLDMEYRYYHLMERLRATEVKIHNYDKKRYSEDEDYNPVIHGLAFSEKSWNKSAHEHDEPMAFQRARSFSFPHPSGVMDQALAQVPGSGDQGPDVSGQTEITVENEGMMREQLSRKTVASDQESEQVSIVSGQQTEEMDPRDLNLCGSVSNDADSKLMPILDFDNYPEDKLPQCMRIMEQVDMRSRKQGLDYLGFTESEMRFLASDPLFDVIEPEIAAEIRKQLAEYDSG